MKTLLLHLGAVLIGLSKVGFGGGVGAVATPVLASVFAPGEALGLTLPLLFATDLMALVLYRGRWDRHLAGVLLPGTLTGIALAAPLLRSLSPEALARVIGVLALVSVLAPGLKRPKILDRSSTGGRNPSPLPPPRSGEGESTAAVVAVAKPPGAAAGSAVVGFLAGLVAGFTSTLAHLGGLLVALYLLPQRLSNASFVATASVVYCAMNAAKLIPYVSVGLITRATIVQDLWLLPSLAAGVGAGFLLNRRVSGAAFGRVVRVVAIITSLKLLWQGA